MEQTRTTVIEAHLEEISKHSWDVESLASHLDIEHILVKNLVTRPHQQGEKLDFLHKWKEIKGSDATYEKLILSLLKIENREVAHRVCEILRDPVRDSSHGNIITDISTLDPDTRENLIFILQCNFEQLCRHYASCVVDVCESVRANTTLRILASFLLNLCAYRSPDTGQDTMLFSDVREEMNSMTSINQIFDCISINYATYLDHEVFTLIAEKFGGEKACGHIEEYLKSHQEYINKLKIFEFAAFCSRVRESRHAEKVVFKINGNLLARKLAAVWEVKKVVARILNILPAALRFYSAKKGCLLLTFLTPTLVANAVFPRDKKLTEEQISDFQALSVRWMKCGDFRFNFEVSFEVYFIIADKHLLTLCRHFHLTLMMRVEVSLLALCPLPVQQQLLMLSLQLLRDQQVFLTPALQPRMSLSTI